MKGYFIECDGKVHCGTKPATLKLLKAIAKGETHGTPEEEGFKEIGPVAFSVGDITPEDATALFTKISLG